MASQLLADTCSFGTIFLGLDAEWMISKFLILASIDTRLGCLMQVAQLARSSAAAPASHVSNRLFVNLHRLHPFFCLGVFGFLSD